MNSLIGVSIRSTLAIFIVISLFMMMQALIGQPPQIVEPSLPKMPVIDYTHKPPIEFPKTPKADVPPAPKEAPPAIVPKTAVTTEATTQLVFHAPIKNTTKIVGPSAPSGGLMPIVKVQPVYPSAALSRGYEGYCVVEYTVSPSGFTQDVRVVDGQCTHKAFQKPSIKAAQKFKYRPKTVDGHGVAVLGVQNRFTFNLD